MAHHTTSTGLFDLIGGLPVHVLISHAVVVFLPLAVLTLILVITIPKLRSHYRYPAVGLAIIGAISAVIAEQSGQALQARVGYPGMHSEWGGMVPPVAVALAVLSVVWLIVSRMASSRGKVVAALIGGVVIVVGIVAVALTVQAGHSGSVVTWSDRVAGTEPETTDSEVTVPEVTDSSVADMESEPEMIPVEPDGGTGASGDVGVLGIQAVAANASEESCWAIIDDNVYDLTDWISSHPGGSSRIIGLCGTDGTSQFQGQHGGSSSAQGTLERYLLGAVGDPIP